MGKRALGYCIAKRMVALNSLDLRDSAGMVMDFLSGFGLRAVDANG